MTNVHRFKCNVHLFLSGFNNCRIFSEHLRKALQIYFIKPHPVAKYVFHSDTQKDVRTDRHEVANSPFSQFLFRY